MSVQDLGQKVEECNRLQALASKKDSDISELMEKIKQGVEILSNPQATHKQKYESVISVEFLIIKIRTLVEFEHITIKNILSTESIVNSFRTFFTKRDIYLAQVSQKLTTIQNDISILSKLVYQQNFNK